MCTHRLKKNAVHCAGCHRDFGGVTGFDSHQRFDPFRCLDPPYRGLTQDTNGVWRSPGPPQARERKQYETGPLSGVPL
jgi:hypothetical protein